jgi:hypothetical protein
MVTLLTSHPGGFSWAPPTFQDATHCNGFLLLYTLKVGGEVRGGGRIIGLLRTGLRDFKDFFFFTNKVVQISY